MMSYDNYHNTTKVTTDVTTKNSQKIQRKSGEWPEASEAGIPRVTYPGWAKPKSDQNASVHVERQIQPARNRDARRARARTTDERGFDVLGSCLATVPAKQLRQRARERTKTRVSLAGQIHCGFLTQLHVGAGPVRE